MHLALYPCLSSPTDFSEEPIFVQAGRKSVSKIAAEENAKLDTMVGVGSKSRLASHATVTGDEDITVEVLGFSSGL
jgi:2Fe-2S ferredoxin